MADAEDSQIEATQGLGEQEATQGLGEQKEIGDCIKCMLKVTPQNEGRLSRKSKQIIHSGCVIVYKTVCRKCTTQTTFRIWWSRLSAQEQIEYYRKRCEVNAATPGRKRG